ncbi:hypothetical protein [uncultured Desulfovibrio sp.]|uniref:hypothetical protein n=1 Tax=uncultured Desulfovibrio sp. TaxID=167968 RepID=UPI001C3BCB5D|nr:hypothetical protein [uncultured Desulfovibrio sp.]HIX41067.1 hypothetical protein [Candidatus Desulfovibrio intestinigallinarum]
MEKFFLCVRGAAAKMLTAWKKFFFGKGKIFQQERNFFGKELRRTAEAVRRFFMYEGKNGE